MTFVNVAVSSSSVFKFGTAGICAQAGTLVYTSSNPAIFSNLNLPIVAGASYDLQLFPNQTTTFSGTVTFSCLGVGSLTQVPTVATSIGYSPSFPTFYEAATRFANREEQFELLKRSMSETDDESSKRLKE
jgi:hypothetical protein